MDAPVEKGVPKWFLNRRKDFRDGSWFQMTSNVLETKLREDIERLKKCR
jgi:small subunit ribosomal protein S18e